MGSLGTRLSISMALLAIATTLLLSIILVEGSVLMLRSQAIQSGNTYAILIAEAFVQKHEIMQGLRPNPPGNEGPGPPPSGSAPPPPPRRMGQAPSAGEPPLPPLQVHIRRFARMVQAMQMSFVLSDGTVMTERTPLADGSSMSDEQVLALWGRLQQQSTQNIAVEVFGSSAAIMTPVEEDDEGMFRAVMIQLPTATVNDVLEQHGRTLMLFGAAAALLSGLLGLALSRTIARPLARVVHTAEQYRLGDLSAKSPEEGPSETRTLAATLNTMAGALQDRIQELQAETARRTQLETELSIAARLQASLLPAPGIHRYGALSVGSWNHQAREVGGDFFGFWQISPEELCVVIGDATGKGMSAALLAEASLGALQSASEAQRDAASIMRKANVILCRRFGQDGYFVTAILALVNFQQGTVQLCIAGHPPALLAVDTGIQRIGSRKGFPLALDSTCRFENIPVQLGQHSTLLLYTDGVNETFDAAGGLYGIAGLERDYADTQALPVERLLDTQVARLEKFRNSPEVSDDATLLVLRWGARPEPKDAKVEVIV